MIELTPQEVADRYLYVPGLQLVGFTEDRLLLKLEDDDVLVASVCLCGMHLNWDRATMDDLEKPGPEAT